MNLKLTFTSNTSKLLWTIFHSGKKFSVWNRHKLVEVSLVYLPFTINKQLWLEWIPIQYPMRFLRRNIQRQINIKLSRNVLSKKQIEAIYITPSDPYSDLTLGLSGLWVGGWSVTEGCYWGPKRSSSQGVRDGASAGQHTWHNKTDGIRIASYLIGFPFQECDREIKFGRSFLNNTQYTRKESSLYCWRNYKVNDEMQVIWIMMLLITLITLLMAGKY